MVNVRIKDHVQYAHTYEEGQAIYDLIAPAIERGETVTISFDGFKAVPSSFVNAALLQLTDRFSMVEIKSRLAIADSTKFINDLIKRGFETAEAKKMHAA